jgi:hypothetical protein
MSIFIISLAALLLAFGMKTPKGKLVKWGIGQYYDRTGICLMATVILILGILVLAASFII